MTYVAAFVVGAALLCLGVVAYGLVRGAGNEDHEDS